MTTSMLQPRVDPHTFIPDPAHPFIPPSFQRLRAYRAATRRAMPSRPGGPRIVHLCGGLGAGGAERQLVTLVAELARRQLDVSVLSMEPLNGPSSFHLPTLQKQRVPVSVAQSNDPADLSLLQDIPHIHELAAELPNWLKPWPLEIARSLLLDPPDILHIWLDFTNVAGAIAALMTGVPTIILSTRSVNPTHFPYLNVRWFQPWYRFLATIPDLIFLNNSQAGQMDYAQWMDVLPSRFGMIRNGIDASLHRPAAPAQIAAFRRELQIAADDQLLIGVFRLSEEKRPLLFLDVAEAVMLQCPRVHTTILGHGPMESQVRSQIAASPFRDRIHLLSPRTDMPVVYSAADVLLQTSILEGTPNTLLEAQAAGCPIVTTPSGGSVECVLDGETGFIAATPETLADCTLRILQNKDLRTRLSQNGPAFVHDRFNLRRMIDAHIGLYQASS